MTLADPAGNLKGFVLGLRLGPGLGNGSGGQIVLRSSDSTNRKLPPNTALLKIRGGELFALVCVVGFVFGDSWPAVQVRDRP